MVGQRGRNPQVDQRASSKRRQVKGGPRAGHACNRARPAWRGLFRLSAKNLIALLMSSGPSYAHTLPVSLGRMPGYEPVSGLRYHTDIAGSFASLLLYWSATQLTPPVNADWAASDTLGRRLVHFFSATAQAAISFDTTQILSADRDYSSAIPQPFLSHFNPFFPQPKSRTRAGGQVK